jgi:Rieske Fe-S protein
MSEPISPRCPSLSRRSVLRVACAGLGAGACGQPGYDQPTGPIAAGNVSDLPVGAFKVMGEVVVARDSGGIYAMSAVCTHAGCLIAPNRAGGLSCPCHGAVFDRDGGVLAGPARRPLPHFQVDLASSGNITVEADNVVALDVRKPIG